MTQEGLKEELDYDSTTGIFTWKKPARGRRKIVGSLDMDGYRVVHFGGKTYKAHRLAWLYIYGSFPKKDIDHINRKKHDNRICNLREVTRAVNLHNTGMYRHNTSGFKGVSWSKNANKWQATISYGGKLYFLGYFVYKNKALEARQQAEQKHHSCAH